MRLTLAYVLTTTQWHKAQLEHYRKVLDDPERTVRRKAQECVVCYYGKRLSGAAVTSRQCGGCETILRCGTRDVDRLCKPCAERYGLCKHCGADLELKTRRKLETRMDTTGEINEQRP